MPLVNKAPSTRLSTYFKLISVELASLNPLERCYLYDSLGLRHTHSTYTLMGYISSHRRVSTPMIAATSKDREECVPNILRLITLSDKFQSAIYTHRTR